MVIGQPADDPQIKSTWPMPENERGLRVAVDINGNVFTHIGTRYRRPHFYTPDESRWLAEVWPQVVAAVSALTALPGSGQEEANYEDVHPSPQLSADCNLPIPVPFDLVRHFNGNASLAITYTHLFLRTLWDGKWHSFTVAELAESLHTSPARARGWLESLERAGAIDAFRISGHTKAYRLHRDDNRTPKPSVRRLGTRKPVPRSVRQSVYDRDNWRCIHCGSDKDLSLDHIIPWALGGSDEASNLQTLCRPCNSKKGAKTWVSSETNSLSRDSSPKSPTT